MKPTPLLDLWQKPEGAGEPVAVLATTFALEPDFFERNCLARFLEVSSVNEDTGSVEDIVAGVELHELLQKTSVTVLADRSAPVQRTTLLWDLLGCQVEGGLLHAKVAVLLWERATRVILGSANLTAAGYRRQIEIGLAADLGPACLFSQEVLFALADELASYLPLVPGHDPDAPVFARAAMSLSLFRDRIAEQPQMRTPLRVAFAPTNPKTSPFEARERAWIGAQPLFATHLSPFWDTNDDSALAATRRLLTGRPASRREQRVAVVSDPRGRAAFPSSLAGSVDAIRMLRDIDREVRVLHAKCLLLESDEWVAALVGSSNHTKAGLGLVNRRHREVNVWLGAPRRSREGKALLQLVQLGKKVAAGSLMAETSDEDEVELPALPACFGLCRVARDEKSDTWCLMLGITLVASMPTTWTIRLSEGAAPLLTRAQWASTQLPQSVVTLAQQSPPMYVLVEWDGHRVPWAVIADDRHVLPPLPVTAKLQAHQLLEALSAGRSLTQALREVLEQEQADRMSKKAGIDLNPLTRLEVRGSLLRRGRALAASLQAMQKRLERPASTIETLRARLASPLGPEFVATKVIEAAEAGRQSRAEAVFTLAEIALSIERVQWSSVLPSASRVEGCRLVEAALVRLDALSRRIDHSSVTGLSSYATRATQESLACLKS